MQLGDDDRVRDDDFERDFGGAEPADPLGQSMPDVDRGAPRRGGRSRPQDARTQRDSARRRRASVTSHDAPSGRSPARGSSAGRRDFLRASYQELRRVQWPDRRQVGQGTAVTLGFVIVAGAYLGLLDAIWNPVIQAIL